MLVGAASCARKTKPPFVIKHESVSSIEFKRTVYSAENPLSRSYLEKRVTDKEDVENIICWVEDLKLEKKGAIEVPIERIQFVIVLKGIKDHRLVFMDEYVIFDATAYTYTDPEQMAEVSRKYNLLNYSEQTAELGIII